GDDGGDGGEVVADHDGVGGLQGEVGARSAHRDPGVRGGQGRSVVDAITDHGHSLLIGFEFADGGDLVVGQQLGAHVGDTDLLREPDGGGGIVAGEQHGVGAGQPGHCSDGGGGFG